MDEDQAPSKRTHPSLTPPPLFIQLSGNMLLLLLLQLYFAGQYQLCKTFPKGQSCHVGESRCSFPHYREEIQFWQLDRNGDFDIDLFVKQQRELLRTGTHDVFIAHVLHMQKK